MPAPINAFDIDLTPIPGKHYFSLTREWREEFIYFLHGRPLPRQPPRSPVLQPGRAAGVATPDDFYGGTIKGITEPSRLHRGARLHGDLALTGLRE